MAVFYPSTSSVFTIKDTGGTARNISPYIKSIDGLPGPRGLVDATALGATGKAWAVGLEDYTITIELMWSSDANVGPDTIFAGLSRHTAATQFVFTPIGTGRTYTGNCWVKNYNIHTKIGDLLTATVELQSDGPISVGP